MLGLMRDIVRYYLFLRLADAERSVAFLPGKSHAVFVEPSRTVALQFLYRFGQRNRRGTAIRRWM